jgi:hypothetical protein
MSYAAVMNVFDPDGAAPCSKRQRRAEVLETSGSSDPRGHESLRVNVLPVHATAPHQQLQSIWKPLIAPPTNSRRESLSVLPET